MFDMNRTEVSTRRLHPTPMDVAMLDIMTLSAWDASAFLTDSKARGEVVRCYARSTTYLDVEAVS